ncbi:MAG TPA: citrate/2-methylcitrate synthase, partial [Anaerolineaceae bacterium]|nr:citrate/2-methylcitrate synthase [Anaerolineaceae bacterium]
MIIHDRIAAQLLEKRERMAQILNHYGSFKVCDVTVDQIYGGIRGVQIQVSDVSYVDPYEGLHFRGYSVPETVDLLPKAPGSEYPMVGGLYYLLMADQLPSQAEALEVEEDWKRRSAIPEQVFAAVRAMPADTHPMTLFSIAIMAMQPQAVFPKQYTNGLQKSDFWKYSLEDSLNLTARLPGIAAFIYNHK